MIEAAVIGCGRMGAFTSGAVRLFAPECWFPLSHAEAIGAEPRIRLAAMCDADPAQLERARAAFGVPAGFTDAGVLAQAVRPQLASVATRTIGRAGIIETLYAAGTRAFHLEKPLCNSVAELGNLQRILGESGVHATFGAVRRNFHIYRHAVRLARSGEFGPLLEVRANFGVGALYWVHPHAIDLILLAAEGSSVVGVDAKLGALELAQSTVTNDPVVESATIWFADGVAGHIGRGPGLDFVLSCRDGEIIVRADGRTLEIAAQRGEDPYLERSSYPVGSIPAQGSQGTLASITQLADCLEGDPAAQAANAHTKRDILVGQAIAFACVQSHWEGSRIVTLDAIDPEMQILAQTGGNFA